jgi:ankyrin repeat protein
MNPKDPKNIYIHYNKYIYIYYNMLNTIIKYFTPSYSETKLKNNSQKKLKENLEIYKKLNSNSVINSIGNLSSFYDFKDNNYKDEKGNTILHIAIEHNWIPVVRMLLLRKDANYFNLVNNDGDTPLIYAIKKKNIDILNILLDNSEIDINLGNKDGYTPLMNAILKKLSDIAVSWI